MDKYERFVMFPCKLFLLHFVTPLAVCYFPLFACFLPAFCLPKDGYAMDSMFEGEGVGMTCHVSNN